MKIGQTGLNNSLIGKCEICGVKEDVDHVISKDYKILQTKRKIEEGSVVCHFKCASPLN